MTFLTSHLSFPSSSTSGALPPPKTHVVLSDTLNSPAQFVLYHLISAALGKAGNVRRKVVWVDMRGEGRASLEAVMKKIGTPLPPSTSSQFIHIAPSSLPLCISVPAQTPRIFDAHGKATLRNVYDTLSSHVADECLVILDGLTVMANMGVLQEEIAKFVRATYAKVRLAGGILVSTLHTDSLPLPLSIYSPAEDIELLERVLRVGKGVWWRIQHLGSGRSGDVMGEISSHPFGGMTASAQDDGKEDMPFVPRSKPLQYRLETSTVKVFAKGTGRGFL
ncbi:uncharacterized protein L203_102303 [Cryptococcus depauperatus CBS 7841]|uniref:Uncharacterized protein n=1 Tax=Cryptococcus depauperatus CBS 7841 TaxID=1295531 RepID=A0A1E3ICN6_9TREE|nr:hypothetical protein L203_04760 [Cryptococcus depauperatus CBS 7841]